MMDDYLGSLPMIRALFPTMGDGTIAAINRTGQVVIILVGIQILYKTSLGEGVRRRLAWLINFHASIRQSIRNLSPKVDQLFFDCEMSFCVFFSLILAYLLIFVTHEGPFGYLLYPFKHVWYAIMVWGQLDWQPSLLILIPLKCIGLCAWALVSFTCVYGFFLGVPIQAVTKTSEFIATRYSRLAYHLVVATETIMGGVILLFTAAPFK